jgi:hypothetical protein
LRVECAPVRAPGAALGGNGGINASPCGRLVVMRPSGAFEPMGFF